MTTRQQTVYWGIATAVFLLLLYGLGNVIMPFLLGGAIAYVLDPVADRLQRLGLSRALSVAIIALVALLIFVLLVLLVIPTLISQASQLIATAPALLDQLQEWLTARFPDILDEGSTIRTQLDNIGTMIQSRGGEVLNTLLSSALGLVNVAVLLVIVPVVAIYLLLDWDRMTGRIDALLPRDHVHTIRDLSRQIDQTLASFIRGQGLVCLILGVYYAAGMALIGLNFGLVVGAVAGALTFIPYVGAIVGGGLAIGLALFQFWGDWPWIIAVYAIFQSGQFVEGNILTPKLVGDSVGLHPVWLLFALSVFGSLFGFVGLLVAVPVAAIIGVLMRFALDRYRASPLYRGTIDD
ncbi:Predicted PurR-regulated permease PerM [Loktanella fryxellensis]|uniref:Predicted PurR-regulated permease PerM n=1 Tax=Loktanella fryxellensis TaxID=245187 RepID=A0A1H8FGC8_9RHOB|nr:AI-2E family transporter [Loktanella fryxellensis]SEN30695.1 Predicted PurR-regulated permease PerM [Loktanella fryxellensis]